MVAAIQVLEAEPCTGTTPAVRMCFSGYTRAASSLVSDNLYMFISSKQSFPQLQYALDPSNTWLQDLAATPEPACRCRGV